MVKDEELTTTEQVVSIEEAERLINIIRNADDLLYEEEPVAAFLLLLHTLTYCDPSDREDYMRMAERVLVTYTHTFQSGVESLLAQARDELRGVERVTVELKPEPRRKGRK
jgi:hypothetical protein